MQITKVEGELSMITIEQPAVRGALLLDERGPEGWWDKIDLDRLDIASVTNCVCGQVFGDYLAGIVSLQINEAVPPSYYGSAVHYGFARSGVGNMIEESWREQIMARRMRHASQAAEPVETVLAGRKAG